MRTDVTPIWTTAEVHDGFATVRFGAVVDCAWLQAVHEVARTWGGETRGQTWGRVSFADGVIQVSDVAADTDIDNLRSYLTDVIAAASVKAASWEQARDREAETARQAEATQRSADEELQRRLRDLS